MDPVSDKPLSDDEIASAQAWLHGGHSWTMSPKAWQQACATADRLVAELRQAREERDKQEKHAKHMTAWWIKGMACEACRSTRKERLAAAFKERMQEMSLEQLADLITDLENEPIYTDEELELASERDARLNAEMEAENASLRAQLEEAKRENRELLHAVLDVRSSLHAAGRRPETCHEMSVLDEAIDAARASQASGPTPSPTRWRPHNDGSL